MKIKLSDYILEQSISDASVNDIEFERIVAELNVAMAIVESCVKAYNMRVYQEEAAPPPSMPKYEDVKPIEQAVEDAMPEGWLRRGGKNSNVVYPEDSSPYVTGGYANSNDNRIGYFDWNGGSYAISFEKSNKSGQDYVKIFRFEHGQGQNHYQVEAQTKMPIKKGEQAEDIAKRAVRQLERVSVHPDNYSLGDYPSMDDITPMSDVKLATTFLSVLIGLIGLVSAILALMTMQGVSAIITYEITELSYKKKKALYIKSINAIKTFFETVGESINTNPEVQGHYDILVRSYIEHMRQILQICNAPVNVNPSGFTAIDKRRQLVRDEVADDFRKLLNSEESQQVRALFKKYCPDGKHIDPSIKQQLEQSLSHFPEQDLQQMITATKPVQQAMQKLAGEVKMEFRKPTPQSIQNPTSAQISTPAPTQTQSSQPQQSQQPQPPQQQTGQVAQM